MQTGLEYYWAYMEAVDNWAKKWLAGPYARLSSIRILKTSPWANWAKFIFRTNIFIILPVPMLYAMSWATLAHGHLSSSHLIYYDQYSDKYRSHNLVTNVQWAVSHRRGFMTTFYDHCHIVIEGIQWQDKGCNYHNQLVI